MTDMDEIAKACFDRQEFERHEDRPSHIIEKWDDIDETARTYWREFVKPLLSFIRAAELRGRASGMRECADWVEQIYGPGLANSFRYTASKLSPT